VVKSGTENTSRGDAADMDAALPLICVAAKPLIFGRKW
jgi:hypothetical protein